MEFSLRNVVPPIETPQDNAAPPLQRQALSDVERSVVLLSRTDSRSSLDDGGSWRRSAALLLGAKPRNALADPDLEGLRRYAISIRLRRENRTCETRLQVGKVTAEKAAEVERLVASWGIERRRRNVWVGPAILAAFATGAYLAIIDWLGDRVVALVVVGLLLTIAISMVRPARRR